MTALTLFRPAIVHCSAAIPLGNLLILLRKVQTFVRSAGSVGGEDDSDQMRRSRRDQSASAERCGTPPRGNKGDILLYRGFCQS